MKIRKHYSGFNGNCPKPKMIPFFEKGVFGMGEQVVFTVFLKSCALLKIVFSAKQTVAIKR